jgi:hypothetical protein
MQISKLGKGFLREAQLPLLGDGWRLEWEPHSISEHGSAWFALDLQGGVSGEHGNLVLWP